MKWFFNYYRRIFFLIFMATFSSGVVADYVMYGSLDAIKVGYPDYRVNVSLEDIDWEDTRPLKCVTDAGMARDCIIRIESILNSSANVGNSYIDIPGARVSSKELDAARVRTLGQYFNYLRGKGVNITGYYEWQGQFRNLDHLYIFSICMKVRYDQSEQTIACSQRGIVTQPGCQIQESQLSLVHGTLSADRVNGNVASTDVTISCGSNGSARLMTPNPQPRLPLAADGSLFSTLTVEGKPLSQGVMVNAGPGGTKVTLTSTLGTVGNNPDTGRFSGSVVVVLAKP